MHFPNTMEITQNTTDLLVIEDWHNLGNDMTLTFDAWFDNFNKSWPQIENKYGNEFYRLWSHYLKMGAGAFKARKIQIWHIVFSKDGLLNGYRFQR
ncbi:cyclopropane-fatty-acyl-phospholipid synthase-like protein [Leptotrombidium deliense]|uniref:Cyclopropane-fatty-acyl-phospholipid synthase-like protein n=1 Tax=Leptotrombidium deliense TaxID=299467 RepID=A0A443SS87_9ACAR|nr:cyclopropane-fatty-acyl-phospholipid synthase-like protein [Leptotrombidium deliense]